MGIPNETHQVAADAIASLGDRISLHTGPGGTTGANEATGGGYSRKQTAWTSGSTGVVDGSTVNIPVVEGDYVEAGIWSAGGTFVGSEEFTTGYVHVSGSGASVDVTPGIRA